jgi:hypothetical protein
MNDWKPPIKGLTWITGEPDTGKTTFALTVPGVAPGEIIFIDDDMKSEGLAQAMAAQGTPFGYYVNFISLVSDKKRKPREVWDLMGEVLTEAGRKVPHAKVLIWDNFSSHAEDAIKAYGMTVVSQISDLTENQVRNASTFAWPYIYQIYNSFLDDLTKMADMLLIITHVREKWIGQVRTDRLEARGQRPLVERSNFRVWTRHNGDPADGGAPIGLILKRIVQMSVTNEGIRPVNVLPRKVKPLTWAKIIEYQQDPLGSRSPRPDELPTPHELSILDGELTADQKAALILASRAAQAEGTIADDLVEPSLSPEMEEKRTQVRQMAALLKPPPVIARKVGVELSQVMAWIKPTE